MTKTGFLLLLPLAAFASEGDIAFRGNWAERTLVDKDVELNIEIAVLH